MNDMIAIHTTEINQESIKTVNARDVHAFVESKQEFANWIKARIAKYGFVENEDFSVDKFINGENSSRFAQTDYYISLDMAKELGMVEANDKGRQIRRYFIAKEKDVERLQLENTQLLEKRLEQQRTAYLELKGEIGGDTVEFYTNKLEDTKILLGEKMLECREKDKEIAKLKAKPKTAAQLRENFQRSQIEASPELADQLHYANQQIEQLREQSKEAKKVIDRVKRDVKKFDDWYSSRWGKISKLWLTARDSVSAL